MTTTFLPQPPSEAAHQLLDRQAVRFLFAHRFGRLLTEDATTGEPQITLVHYIPDESGALLAYLPAEGDHADAIGRGGDSLLSVEAPYSAAPRQLMDKDGLATEAAIRHVQAEVQTEFPAEVGTAAHVLARQVRLSPTRILPASSIPGLVGVRLHLLRVHARLHPVSTGDIES